MISRVLILTLCLSTVCDAEKIGGPTDRIVRARPETGPCVKVDGGYMVPYRQMIAGTDESILMIPVPGLAKSAGKAIEPFWMGRYEITSAQFKPYSELHEWFRKPDSPERDPGKPEPDLINVVTVDAVTAPTEIYDPSFRFEYSSKPNSPAPSMTQFAARQYTKWLSCVSGIDYCLPTLTQWQHACRGGTDTKYFFGDIVENRKAVARKFCISRDPLKTGITLTTGQTLPNRYGLCDMHGSLAEWVVDDQQAEPHYQTHLMCGGSFLDPLPECQWDSAEACSVDYWDEDPNIPLSPWWLASTDAVKVGFRIISPLRSLTDAKKRSLWESDSEQLTRDVAERIKWGRGYVGKIRPTR